MSLISNTIGQFLVMIIWSQYQRDGKAISVVVDYYLFTYIWYLVSSSYQCVYIL